MTIPAPVTDLAIVPTPSSAEALLTWSHTGTNLDRFHIEAQIPDSGFGLLWLKLVSRPKADFFVSGTSYQYRIAARPGQVFRVTAFSAVANEGPSLLNPTVTFSESIDGTWLLPVKNGQVQSSAVCWIGRDAGSSVEEHDHALVAIPTRQEEISQVGALHLEKGSIEGTLMERHGLIANEWLKRLRDLIRRMDSYEAVFYVNNVSRTKVEVYGPIEKHAKTMNGTVAWEVVVSYRELA